MKKNVLNKVPKSKPVLRNNKFEITNDKQGHTFIIQKQKCKFPPRNLKFQLTAAA